MRNKFLALCFILFSLFLFSLSFLFLLPQKTLATNIGDPCNHSTDTSYVCSTDQSMLLWCNGLNIWAQLSPCASKSCSNGVCAGAPPPVVCTKTDEVIPVGSSCCNTTDKPVTCDGAYKCEANGVCPGPLGPPVGTPRSGINQGDTCTPATDTGYVCSDDYSQALACTGITADRSGHYWATLQVCPSKNCAYGACGGGVTCGAPGQPTNGLACCYASNKPAVCDGVSKCETSGVCPTPAPAGQGNCPSCAIGYSWSDQDSECVNVINSQDVQPATFSSCSGDQVCYVNCGCGRTLAECAANHPFQPDRPPMTCPKNGQCHPTYCDTSGCFTALGFVPTSPDKFIAFIFAFLLGISGGIAILLIIISGYKFMASQGKPEALQEAREQLTAAIVGLIFVILSFAILNIIGVNILKIFSAT